MAKEIDRVMKMLASKYPTVFMQLLFGNQSNVRFDRVEDTAINIPERQSDKLFHISENGRKGIISFEFLIEPDKRELREYHKKSGMLTATFDCEVVTVIIYLEKGRYKSYPDSYVSEIAGIRNQNRFEVRHICEYKEQIESGELKELIPLLVLCEEKPDISVLEKEKAIIDRIPDPKERADMLAIAMMIAFRKFAEELVREFFRKERITMKESDFVQEFIEEGRQIGQQIGRKVGELSLVKRLIEKKFGHIQQDVNEKIELLNFEELEELGLLLFDIDRIDEIEDWLEPHLSHKETELV